MLNFYKQLADTLKQAPAVLATVTSTAGSVPREIGAKMFICADNTTVGTIGGGAGEAKVYQQALEIFHTGKKQFVEIDLSGAKERETQGICGGKMQVWLELWNSNYLQLVNQIIVEITSGKNATLVTPFSQEISPYLQPENQPLTAIPSFIEILQPPPTLLIIGAGHIAVPLAQIASLAGFQIIVQDDRPEFATAARFPEALMVVSQPIECIKAILDKFPNLYVALVTRGYLQDLPALRILGKYQLPYVGMVGSRKRIITVYKMMQDEGYSLAKLQHIHAPIGLEIGALTPAEIAVSICAELIKVRRQTPKS